MRGMSAISAEPPLIDITPPITPHLNVWPGDTPVSREVLLDMQRGANITLSTLRATVHLGAHADAPNHYGRDAGGIETQPLERYIGPAQLVHVETRRGRRISVGDVQAGLAAGFGGAAAVSCPRLLLATGTFPDPCAWNTDFAALEPALVDWLHAAGVVLVGLDTPSADLFDSKDLPAHARLLATGMAILEGLVLRAVPAGRYELIALPLPLLGFDASPVRAVLRPLRD